METMEDWMKDTLATGALASVATTAAVALMGKLEDGSAIAPINAISHMIWGDEAARTEEVDVVHTLVGLGINAAAITSWAGLHELLMPRHCTPSIQRAVACGSAIAFVAYLTDYHVVPKRFTPGFEKRLSNAMLLGVYAVLALSLAAGSLYSNRQEASG